MQLFLTSLVVVNVRLFGRFSFYFFLKHLHFYPIFLTTIVVLVDSRGGWSTTQQHRSLSWTHFYRIAESYMYQFGSTTV